MNSGTRGSVCASTASSRSLSIARGEFPTIRGLPASAGLSSCSTDAKKASMSTWATQRLAPAFRLWLEPFAKLANKGYRLLHRNGSIELMFSQLFPPSKVKFNSSLATCSINHNNIAANVIQSTHATAREHHSILDAHAKIGGNVSPRLYTEGHPCSQERTVPLHKV